MTGCTSFGYQNRQSLHQKQGIRDKELQHVEYENLIYTTVLGNISLYEPCM